MPLKRRGLLVLAGLALMFVPLVAAQTATEQAVRTRLFAPERYLEHVKYLASEELEGRLAGSPGAALAAQYLIRQFEAAGCEPAGENGGWTQPFEVRKGKRLIEANAALEISGIERQWQVGKDWIPFPFTELGDVAGPLAFAGYGVRADAFDYDDYADFDAEGKVLLILRYEPKAEDPAAEFGGATPSRYAIFYRKARVAARAGAKALLIVNPPNRDPDRDELLPFDPYRTVETFPLPMVHVSRELAAAILAQAGQPDLTALVEQLDRERKPLSRDLGLTVTLRTGVEHNWLNAENVLAMVPGAGSTTETIIVGAHRDHLGRVPPQFDRQDMSPVIHPGADDNASGTAALIELARAIRAGPPLRRNVLFIAFDAEEMGLVGSRHFVEHPTVALEDVRAMVNFDMIGRLSQGKYVVFGTGTAAEFPDLVARAADEAGVTYRAAGGLAGNSDHAPFIEQRIPALFAFTGVHQQYHRPEDEWRLIDADGAALLLDKWHRIVAELAQMQSGPEFTEPEPHADDAELKDLPKPAVDESKERASAEATRESDEPPTRRGMRVRLGIIPDMVGDGEPGMLVDTVLDGGAAQAAGFRSGDRIMKIGADEVRDIYAYMRLLGELKPGDEVDILIRRDGQEQTLKVKLQAAQRRSGDD